MGFCARAGTYLREQQLIQQQGVIAALQATMADRDVSFWRRSSQFDWSEGEGQELFTNAARYRSGHQFNVNVQGTVSITDEPVNLATTATTTAGTRGGLVAGGNVFFPWTSGLYTHQAWSTLTAAWATKTVPAGFVTDMCTDGSSVFMVGTFAGVWSTSATVPANTVQYDAGAVVYTRIVYDPLRKKLYGITSAGAALHSINSGGAATVIFDFVSGVLSGLEYHDGNIVVSWNSYALSSTTQLGIQDSAIYEYDGTNVTLFADFGDGVGVGALKSHQGSLYLVAYSVNAERILIPGETSLTQYAPIALQAYVISGGVVSFLYSLGANGNGTLIFANAQYVDFVGPTHLWRYDTVLGGFSQVMGDQVTNTAFLTINGLVAVWDGSVSTLGPTILAFTSGAGGRVYALANAATATTSTASGARQLTSSRMDIGLPYIPKFWYCFDAVFDPLPTGGSVLLEYSVDDGRTFTNCVDASTGSATAFGTVGGTTYTALVEQVNPHIVYRLTIAGRVLVHSVAARFAPSNPNLKMWQMTLTCYNQLRLRNNVVSDLYGQDMLTYLFNISQQSETVTFYDNGEPLGTGAARTPHTVWVMSMKDQRVNTSPEYRSDLQEGDVAIVLWETAEP